MIHLSSHYKRLKMRFLKMALLAVFVSIFFMPSFVKFVKTGDNMFTVFLNGQEVGVVDSVYFTAVILLIIVSSVATPLVLKALFAKMPPETHPAQQA